MKNVLMMILVLLLAAPLFCLAQGQTEAQAPEVVPSITFEPVKQVSALVSPLYFTLRLKGVPDAQQLREAKAAGASVVALTFPYDKPQAQGELQALAERLVLDELRTLVSFEVPGNEVVKAGEELDLRVKLLGALQARLLALKQAGVPLAAVEVLVTPPGFITRLFKSKSEQLKAVALFALGCRRLVLQQAPEARLVLRVAESLEELQAFREGVELPQLAPQLLSAGVEKLPGELPKVAKDAEGVKGVPLIFELHKGTATVPEALSDLQRAAEAGLAGLVVPEPIAPGLRNALNLLAGWGKLAGVPLEPTGDVPEELALVATRAGGLCTVGLYSESKRKVVLELPLTSGLYSVQAVYASGKGQVSAFPVRLGAQLVANGKPARVEVDLPAKTFVCLKLTNAAWETYARTGELLATVDQLHRKHTSISAHSLDDLADLRARVGALIAPGAACSRSQFIKLARELLLELNHKQAELSQTARNLSGAEKVELEQAFQQAKRATSRLSLLALDLRVKFAVKTGAKPILDVAVTNAGAVLVRDFAVRVAPARGAVRPLSAVAFATFKPGESRHVRYEFELGKVQAEPVDVRVTLSYYDRLGAASVQFSGRVSQAEAGSR